METKTIVCILIIVGIILGIVVGIPMYWIDVHNTMVKKDIAAENAKAELASQYQRRADLIPNVVTMVASSAKLEKDTQTEVAGLRSQAISGQQMMTNAKTVQDIQTANNIIDNTLSRLMMVVEQYPDIKTTQTYRDVIINDLEGSENRVTYARTQYNKAAADYKEYAQGLPQSIIVSMDKWDTNKWPLYQSKTVNADVAPVLTLITV